ncbi:MAG: hypothetical protein WAZ19_11945 [Anaerolineae bacterium]
MSDGNSEQIAALEEKIADLTNQLEQARLVVKQWSEISADLSRKAAEARAKNQGLGRGLGGMLLGSKFRSTMRSAAASSNAAISKEVAQKRMEIAGGKSRAQELVRQLQTELTTTKEQYRSLKAIEKSQRLTKSRTSKKSYESIDLLQKLKEAWDLGILTEEEYEEKRKKIVSDI